MKTMKSLDKEPFIYGIVAIILLLCLFDMPYGWYSLVRFLTTAAFGCFAYKAYRTDNKDRMILFIILAVMFQPFFKLSFGRVLWNIIDVVVAGYMIYLLIGFMPRRRK